jgi:hypothetical protein
VDEKKQIINKLFGKNISDKLAIIPPNDKDLANCIAEIKYGYSGTGETVKKYNKEVTVLNCGNGLKAYRVKRPR